MTLNRKSRPSGRYSSLVSAVGALAVAALSSCTTTVNGTAAPGLDTVDTEPTSASAEAFREDDLRPSSQVRRGLNKSEDELPSHAAVDLAGQRICNILADDHARANGVAPIMLNQVLEESIEVEDGQTPQAWTESQSYAAVPLIIYAYCPEDYDSFGVKQGAPPPASPSARPAPPPATTHRSTPRTSRPSANPPSRSEERRVGKERGAGWAAERLKIERGGAAAAKAEAL